MGDPLTIEEYESRNREIVERLNEINTEHTGQTFPEHIAAEWKELNEERDSNVTVIEELRVRQARLEELSRNSENGEGITGKVFHTRRANATRPEDVFDLPGYRSRSATPDQERELLRDGAKMVAEQQQFAHERVDRAEAERHIERLVQDSGSRDGAAVARRIIATGSPAYRRAFNKVLQGREHGLTSEERTALSTAGSGGGYAVPYTLDPTVIKTASGSINPYREISRVEQITTTTWNGVSSAGVTASFAAHATEASDNAPTFGQPTITPAKAQVFIPFDIEIDQDWAGLQTELASMILDAKDDLEATQFTTGNGSDAPYGLLTGATTSVNTASAGAFVVGDLYKLEEQLPPRHRVRASFLTNKYLINKIRQLDTAGGAALYQRLPEASGNGFGQSTRYNVDVIGYPAYESTAINTNNVLTTNTKVAVLGNFSRFVVVDRIGLNIEVLPHIVGGSNNYPLGQRGMYAYWRVGSKVVDAGAFRVLWT